MWVKFFYRSSIWVEKNYLQKHRWLNKNPSLPPAPGVLPNARCHELLSPWPHRSWARNRRGKRWVASLFWAKGWTAKVVVVLYPQNGMFRKLTNCSLVCDYVTFRRAYFPADYVRYDWNSVSVANHEQPRDQFLHVFVWELKNIFLKMTRRGNGLAVYSLTSVYLDENS